MFTKRGRGIAPKFEEQERDVYFAEGRECKVETNGRTREEKYRGGEKVGEVLLINSIYSLERERERERFVLSVIEMERG